MAAFIAINPGQFVNADYIKEVYARPKSATKLETVVTVIGSEDWTIEGDKVSEIMQKIRIAQARKGAG